MWVLVWGDGWGGEASTNLAYRSAGDRVQLRRGSMQLNLGEQDRVQPGVNNLALQAASPFTIFRTGDTLYHHAHLDICPSSPAIAYIHPHPSFPCLNPPLPPTTHTHLLASHEKRWGASTPTAHPSSPPYSAMSDKSEKYS